MMSFNRFFVYLFLVLANSGCAKEEGTDKGSISSKNKNIGYEIFKKYCSSAGEKIYTTVPDVKGFVILKERREKLNWSEQYELDDPYGYDYYGEGYYEKFLRTAIELRFAKSNLMPPLAPPQYGYQFIETVDPSNMKRYRWTARVVEPWQTNKNILKGHLKIIFDKNLSPEPARYGITYDDISTKEDRDHWIAGSSLKVIDTLTNTVIAERVGYMIDLGKGATGGGRSPWLSAADTACPVFPGRPGHLHRRGHTLRFVEKVLLPFIENK